MFAGTFGWKVTTVYVVSGICLGVIGGYLLGKMKLEKNLSPSVRMLQDNSNNPKFNRLIDYGIIWNLRQREHSSVRWLLPGLYTCDARQHDKVYQEVLKDTTMFWHRGRTLLLYDTLTCTLLLLNFSGGVSYVFLVLRLKDLVSTLIIRKNTITYLHIRR